MLFFVFFMITAAACDPVFVSWSGQNVSGVWGFNVSVQMKKMPYDKGFIGIGWNDKPYMTNSTMMILTNNAWETEWSLGKYMAKGNAPPTLIEKQNFTMEIVNGSLTFTFVTTDKINDMYVIFAYAKEWSFHGNNSGIAYTPASAYLKNSSSPEINHSPRLLKSPSVNIKYSPSPIKRSPSLATSIPVKIETPTKNSSNQQKINIMYLVYIVLAIGALM